MDPKKNPDDPDLPNPGVPQIDPVDALGGTINGDTIGEGQRWEEIIDIETRGFGRPHEHGSDEWS